MPGRHGGRGVWHPERGARGGRPARVDRGRQTGLLAHDDGRARGEGPRRRRPIRPSATAWARTPWSARGSSRGTPRAALARLARRAARAGRARASDPHPARADRHRTRGRARGRRARRQRRRADLHDRLRADPRRVGVRHARGARLDVPDPPGLWLGAADHGRARRQPGDRARPRGARGGHPAMDHARGDHHRRRRDVAVVFREQIAAAIGVEEEWAAAATLPTGCLWLLASIERGALQGFQRYRASA